MTFFGVPVISRLLKNRAHPNFGRNIRLNLYLEPLEGSERFRAAVLLAIRDAFDKTSPKKFPVFKKISRPEGRSFTAHTDKNRYFIKSFFFVK